MFCGVMHIYSLQNIAGGREGYGAKNCIPRNGHNICNIKTGLEGGKAIFGAGHGPEGGVTKGQKIFIRFLAVLGHSESILIFCKNDGGGLGSKIRVSRIYP